MNTAAVSSSMALVFGVAVVLWAALRYAGPRPLHEPLWIGAACAVPGVALLNTYVWQAGLSDRDVYVVTASLAAGVLLAVVRGCTVRLFRENGRMMRRDGPTTTLLWTLAVPLHLLFDAALPCVGGRDCSAFGGPGWSSLLLSVGSALFVQESVVRCRARRARTGATVPVP
ncbi:hypothetical protein ACIQWR_37500 [Streptomyces sp. NPDC098789]|uniref:hypothetical protein n=1 Tax=Streptomyces sp. NPDC098789 TaxID=3366098 RepID=UPI0037F553A5